MQFNQSVKKASVFLLVLLGISMPRMAGAQAPQGLNYQAIARDAAGAIIPNHLIGLRFTITNTSGGATLYQETQTATTNVFGLFTINIGSGIVVSGTFSTINWGSVVPWLQVEMDPNGGSSYTNMGTSQLLSVPYALYAASGTQGPAGATWYTGSGAPPGGLGSINDLYLDTVTGNYYKKTGASTWSLQGTLSGGANINGTPNYLIKFLTGTSGTNSLIFDNGTNVGIGTATPTFLLDVIGSATTAVGASSNTNSTGTGFAAANTAASGADVGNGLYGSTQQSNGVGVYGANLNTGGTGVLGIGNDVSSYTLPIGGAGGAFYGNGIGLYGFTSASAGYGVYGKAPNVTVGYGVVGSANGVQGAAPSTGAGGAFFAYDYGISAVITDQNYTGGVQMAGGYFGLGYNGTSDASTTLVEAVATSGTHYKIWGSPVGTVSTTVPDLSGKQVTLHAPETPEFYFQDYGQAALINGKAHIDIDPILAANVKISDKHPLRVFVQLEGDCKGVYVTNKTATGFDVVELGGGTSNVSFQWSITCNVADAKLGKGISPFADLRFEAGPNQDLKSLPSKEASTNTK